MRHLRTLYDLTPDELSQILELSAELKQQTKQGRRTPLLAGHTIAMLFEKPSLRTRVSFEAGMAQLGGHSVFLSTKDAGLDGRESLPDVTRVMSRYVDAIAMRTFSQRLIEDFADHSLCPVINALSDDAHPLQAMTDLLTLREAFDDLTDVHLVYVGDGNNVARSLTIAAAMVDMSLTLCTPPDYALESDFVDELSRRYPTAKLTTSNDPPDAVKAASAVYTDVWASMGQESEAEARKQAFADFQVNAELMSRAPAGCKFLHDLPARRGLEVTDEVMECSESLVFDQAENRMHLAKGLLVWLLREQPGVP